MGLSRGLDFAVKTLFALSVALASKELTGSSPISGVFRGDNDSFAENGAFNRLLIDFQGTGGLSNAFKKLSQSLLKSYAQRTAVVLFA